MSFKTTLRTNINFLHKTFDEKWKVEEDLKQQEDLREALIWDLVRKNTSLESFEIKSLKDQLQNVCVNIWGLNMLLNSWDELARDDRGNFVEPLEDRPMLWGDFINTKLEDLK